MNTYSFSNLYNYNNQEEKNKIYLNKKENPIEKEKNPYVSSNDYYKSKENKYIKDENQNFENNKNKNDSFFNLDQYSQPFSLYGQQEFLKNNEQKYNSSTYRDENYNKHKKIEGSTTNLPSFNSSQLFNDYFIKNSLNK